MRIEHMPKVYREMYNRAMSGHCRRDAIRVHCIMCMGWQRGEVPLCTAPTCPLYPYRMGEAIHGLDGENDGWSDVESTIVPETPTDRGQGASGA